jgi:predicted DCC family thiol-disulfide oxidoreductase YuxK
VNNKDMAGTFFFDGACGVCTRAVYFLVRHNRTGRLRTEPFQAPGSAERLGISESRMFDMSWWLDDSGGVYGGAQAVNAALSVALGTRLPLRIYRIPGIRAVQEAVYRWVADHRYRFPGATPYCESYPVSC